MTPSHDVPSIGRPTNAWAVVSVLCGVVGCLLFTPVVAVASGLIGRRQAKRTGEGHRMATAGLWLGVAWLTLYAIAGVGGVWANRRLPTLIAEGQRPRVAALVNALARGGHDRPPSPDRIGDGRARELAEAVASLGACRDVSDVDAGFTNRDGVFGFELNGTAHFERGTRPLRVRFFFTGTGWGISELDWL